MATHAGNINNLYLFEGFVKGKASTGELIPIKKSIRVVQDEIIFSHSAKASANDKFTALMTNVNGVLYEIKYPFKKPNECTKVGYIAQDKAFAKIPMEIFEAAWSTKGKDWGTTISAFLDDQEKPGVRLKKIAITKRHLIDPYKNPAKDSMEERYNRFYSKVGETEVLTGYVIAKIRAVFFLFSSKSYQDSSLTIAPLDENGNKGGTLEGIIYNADLQVQNQAILIQKNIKPIEHQKRNITYGVVYGNPQTLKKGMYKIELSNLKIKQGQQGQWNPETFKNKSYSFVEKLRFNITNSAGEFDIITADPVSVEEAVLTQFPVQYAHLIKVAKDTENFPDFRATVDLSPEEAKLIEKENDKKDDPDFKGAVTLPPSLQPWANRMAWTYEKSKMIIKMTDVNSFNNFSWLLGQAVWNAIKPKDDKSQALTYVKDSVDFAFSIKSAVGHWGDFHKYLAGYKNQVELAHAKEFIWDKTSLSGWEKHKYWNEIRKIDKADIKTAVLESIEKHPDDFDKFLEASKIGEKNKYFKNLSKLAEKTGDAIKIIDAAVGVYQVVLKSAQVVGTHEKLEENQESFQNLLIQYNALNGVCREGMGTLERYRQATVSGSLKMSQELNELCDKALDAVLGVLTIVPATSFPAGLILLVKGAAETAGDLITTGAKYFDKFVCDGFFTEMAQNRKLLSGMLDSSAANQRLMDHDAIEKDQGKDDLGIQYRLRAEAVSGLVSILTRAGFMKFSEDTEKTESDITQIYLDKIKKYKLDQYIEKYILNDQWSHVIKPLVPVSLYSQWMYITGGPDFTIMDKFSHQIEDKGYIQVSKDLMKNSLLTFGWPAYSVSHTIVNAVTSDTAQASFHKSFPIHTMDAKSLDDFAKAFKTTFTELRKDSIEYTCIYHRKKGIRDDQVKNDPNLGWKAINDMGTDDFDKLPAISPYDQIRVLIILKENVPEAIYPVSLQLFHDKFGFGRHEGPVYKELIKSVDPFLLDCEKQFSSKNGKPRLGCVIYPFYQVLESFVPGTKPIVDFFSWDPFDLMDLNTDESDIINTTRPEREDFKTKEAYRDALDSFYKTLHQNKETRHSLWLKQVFQKKFKDLRYGFKIKMGSSRTEQDIPIGNGQGENTGLDRYKVTLDINDPDQQILLTRHFLQNKTTSFSYPPLFKSGRYYSGVGPVLIKVGGSGDFVMPEKYEHKIAPFDWTQPVEFIVLAWGHEMHDQNYERSGKDWKRMEFPVEMTLVNLEGFDTIGPTYSSNLCYIGELTNMAWAKTPPIFNKYATNFKGAMADIVKLLESKSNSAPILKGIIDAASPMGRYFHPSTPLFAAHFTMSYHTPELKSKNTLGGKEINSVRPFGSLSEDESNRYYSYVLRDFKTKGEIGLKSEKILFDDGIVLDDEYTFSFQAPKSHKDIPAWGYLSDNAFEQWTDEKASILAPTIPKLIQD